MSWSYSRALVAEFLEANCSDIELSAQLSMTPMLDQFCSHGNPMEHSRLSRFGMTCEPLTDDRGEELLTWFREAFHAKTFPLQEKVQELTENDQDSGEKWRGWLAKFDPDSCSWKTAQLSLLGDSGESSVILPRSGMTRGGLLWELPMLERHTSGTGSGFWPTPTASQARSEGSLLQYRRLVDAGVLTREDAESMCQGSLTPPRMKPWTTPTAHNAKETNAPSESSRNTPTLAAQAGGPLNPDWVEWLMGWPIGHTALKPSETDKSRNAEQQHGKCLEAQID